MKISLKLSIIVGLLISVLATNGFSQLTSSPYIIYNNKSCDVELHYRVFDPSNSCSQLCAANNVVIPANSSISISCVIAGSSDIQIVIINIGGQSLSPVANLNYGQGTSGGADWFCFTMLAQTDSGTLIPPASINCSSSVWSAIVGPNDTNIN